MTTRRSLLLGSVAALLGSAARDRQARAQTPGSPSTRPSPTDEAGWIVHLREEEKLALDVYERFSSSEPLFATLASAERRHFDAVGRLLENRGLHDPSRDRGPGEFEDAAMRSLHADFVRRGTTPLARLEVGAEIEELDLSDLRHALVLATSPDVRRVFENLARGSRNHLRHLHSSLGSIGASYAPRHLSREEYDAIVGSPFEPGGGRGGGGRGRRGPP